VILHGSMLQIIYKYYMYFIYLLNPFKCNNKRVKQQHHIITTMKGRLPRFKIFKILLITLGHINVLHEDITYIQYYQYQRLTYLC
jgi:hypothetical protein